MRLYISGIVTVLLVLGFPFIMNEVVDSFRKCHQFFLNEIPPMIPGILENSTSTNETYILICEKYMSNYTFATLYDTANRIPVFSAYEYTREEIGRLRERWKIERQLEPFGADMKVPFVHQASDRVYCSSDTKNKQVDRGHLFPSSHANNDDTKKSTFTLTNAVPQKKSFNSGSWCRMEIKVKDLMNKHCRHTKGNNRTSAYVLTGAVPGNDTINERVNIPSYMWTAFCCYNRNSWVSQAHWAKNVDEKKVQGSSRDERDAKGEKKNKKNNQTEIPSISLEQLHQNLSTFWPNIQLFANCTDILSESSLLDINTEKDYGQDESCNINWSVFTKEQKEQSQMPYSLTLRWK